MTTIIRRSTTAATVTFASILAASPSQCQFRRIHNGGLICRSFLHSDSLPVSFTNQIPDSTVAASNQGKQRKYIAQRGLIFHRSISYASAASNQFSETALDGIRGAKTVATTLKEHTVEPEHLMKHLLDQKKGIARKILYEAGVDYTLVVKATESFIATHPKEIKRSFMENLRLAHFMLKYELMVTCHGQLHVFMMKLLTDIWSRQSLLWSGPVIGQDLSALLRRACFYKDAFGDDKVCVDHLVLAFHSDARFGHHLFKKLDIEKWSLMIAMEAVRKGAGKM